jgi:hypothetical protein
MKKLPGKGTAKQVTTDVHALIDYDPALNFFTLLCD